MAGPIGNVKSERYTVAKECNSHTHYKPPRSYFCIDNSTGEIYSTSATHLPLGSTYNLTIEAQNLSYPVKFSRNVLTVKVQQFQNKCVNSLYCRLTRSGCTNNIIKLKAGPTGETTKLKFQYGSLLSVLLAAELDFRHIHINEDTSHIQLSLKISVSLNQSKFVLSEIKPKDLATSFHFNITEKFNALTIEVLLIKSRTVTGKARLNNNSITVYASKFIYCNQFCIDKYQLWTSYVSKYDARIRGCEADPLNIETYYRFCSSK